MSFRYRSNAIRLINDKDQQATNGNTRGTGLELFIRSCHDSLWRDKNGHKDVSFQNIDESKKSQL